MCCQVAALNKVPVVYVSLEQSKQELRAKALARLAKVQYRHLLRGRLQAGDPESWGKVLEALGQYAERVAPHLTVVEGDTTTTVAALREVIAGKLRQAGARRCLVAIDYLQILPLAPEEAGLVTCTKDKVDHHVSALRRLARDHNASVIAISSENRAGYGSKKMDVFKESGGIEYSADIAAVLKKEEQRAGAAKSDYVVEDLNIVKNRNGERGVVRFKFYAARAEFAETEKRELSEESDE
jgi:replicative DNA helicase